MSACVLSWSTRLDIARQVCAWLSGYESMRGRLVAKSVIVYLRFTVAFSALNRSSVVNLYILFGYISILVY